MAHAQLTAMALLQYVGDMQNLFGIPSNFGYKLSEWTMLQSYSEIPDKESTSVCADHFYDPNKGDGWNVLVPNAKERFEEYYQEALNRFSTNRTVSLQYLGRAIHFIQDVNEPHHASNKVAVLSQHTQFESFASTRIQNVVDNMSGSMGTSLYIQPEIKLRKIFYTLRQWLAIAILGLQINLKTVLIGML